MGCSPKSATWFGGVFERDACGFQDLKDVAFEFGHSSENPPTPHSITSATERGRSFRWRRGFHLDTVLRQPCPRLY